MWNSMYITVCGTNGRRIVITEKCGAELNISH
jgi:hypothetical protein